MSLIETPRNHSGLFICLGVYSLNQLYRQGQICGPVCSLFLRMIADLTVLHQHSCLPGLVLFCRAISYPAEFSQSPSWAGRPMMSRTDGNTSVLVTASLGSYKSLWRIQLLHCLEGQRWWLRITFWAGSEISWWSQSWALEERKSVSIATAPPRLMFLAAGEMPLWTAQMLVSFGSDRGEVWGGRGSRQCSWYGYCGAVSTLR